MNMQEISNFLADLLSKTIMAVFTSLNHNWLPLSIAILTATLMKVYVDAEKLKKSLLNKPKVSILASVIFGAFTPLCACGTMSVVIGMLTTALPWGPVMAFLTSSPLMSPDVFIMLTGIISPEFAIALTVASIIIGLGSGYVTHKIEKKTHFLDNQTRFAGEQTAACGCSDNTGTVPQQSACGCSQPVASEPSCGCSGNAKPAPVQTCGCSSPAQSKPPKRFSKIRKLIRGRELLQALYTTGIKQILLFFVIFVALGFMINYFVPTKLVMALFSPRGILSVPIAALIGLPLYVSGEGAIPLIKSLMDAGAGGGAMLAFMITGQATSAWVIAGITAFMKKRIIGLYVAFILAGGILFGYLYQLFLLIAH